MLRVLKKVAFNNVNEMESRMNGNRFFDKPLLLSFNETKVFNVQNNFVQGTRVDEVHNSHSPNELNKLFLDGYIIDTAKLYKMEPTQAHGKVDYKLIKIENVYSSRNITTDRQTRA